MSGLKLRFEYLVRRAGIAGAIGVLLIASVPGYYWTMIRPQRALVSQLLSEYENALADKNAGISASDRMSVGDARRRAFQGFFPQHAQAPGWISKIYAAADQERVALPRGEYRRQSSARGESPLPLRISLPAKGSYARVRRFVTSALAEVPMLALDEISFQRQAADDAQVEAELRFTLYTGEH